MGNRVCRNASTLCWCCENAYNDCSWSREGMPVPGWQAVRNDLPPQTKGKAAVESFVVLRCPRFLLEERFSGEYRKLMSSKWRRQLETLAET